MMAVAAAAVAAAVAAAAVAVVAEAAAKAAVVAAAVTGAVLAAAAVAAVAIVPQQKIQFVPSLQEAVFHLHCLQLQCLEGWGLSVYF